MPARNFQNAYLWPIDQSSAQRMFSNTDSRVNRLDTWKLRDSPRRLIL